MIDIPGDTERPEMFCAMPILPKDKERLKPVVTVSNDVLGSPTINPEMFHPPERAAQRSKKWPL